MPYIFGEGNGTLLQYSCLENPTDGGAWWAAVYAVAQSRTRLSNFNFTFHFSCIGEGNGNPLQCSCLENPRDGGACWAAIYGVARSQTRLKRLSLHFTWPLQKCMHAKINKPSLQSNEKLGENICNIKTDKRSLCKSTTHKNTCNFKATILQQKYIK